MPATMTTVQVLKQLRHMAALATVPVSGGTAIFAPRSIIVVSHAIDEITLAETVMPTLLITPMGYETPHPGARVIHRATFELVIIVNNRFDSYGEAQLLGASRASATSSVGMGSIEIADALDRDGGAFRKTGSEVGLGIVAFTPRSAGPKSLGEFGADHLAAYEVEIIVFHGNDSSTYNPPTAFAGVAAGGGNVTLTWTHPGNRFDHGGVMVRRAPGATAPATSSSGTLVGNFARSSSGTTDSPGVGTFSYSLWAIYDPDTNVEPGSNPAVGDCDTFSADADRLTATVTVT